MALKKERSCYLIYAMYIRYFIIYTIFLNLVFLYNYFIVQFSVETFKFLEILCPLKMFKYFIFLKCICLLIFAFNLILYVNKILKDTF